MFFLLIYPNPRVFPQPLQLGRKQHKIKVGLQKKISHSKGYQLPFLV